MLNANYFTTQFSSKGKLFHVTLEENTPFTYSFHLKDVIKYLSSSKKWKGIVKNYPNWIRKQITHNPSIIFNNCECSRLIEWYLATPTNLIMNEIMNVEIEVSSNMLDAKIEHEEHFAFFFSNDKELSFTKVLN